MASFHVGEPHMSKSTSHPVESTLMSVMLSSMPSVVSNHSGVPWSWIRTPVRVAHSPQEVPALLRMMRIVGERVGVVVQSNAQEGALGVESQRFRMVAHVQCDTTAV